MDVSCVSVHSRCSSLHKTGPYTVSFFGEKALQKEEENSSARCYQKFELSKQLVGFVFASPLYTTEASNVQVNLLQFTL